MTERSELRAEFSELAELKLGKPLESQTLDALVDIQLRARRTQQQLAHRLEMHELSREAYLDRLNGGLQAAMKDCRALLGHGRFMAIFGEAGLYPEGLVDPQIFHASH